jgi:hypothetical protein
MASIDWKCKCHGGTESKSVLRHNDKDMRLKDKHKNMHIDKSKTHLNWQMYDGYNATCDRMNEKLDELDKMPGANKRKDRVTMQGLEYPVPDGLPDNKVHEWHMKVHDILRAMYGNDLYFVNSYEHFDEVHEYRKAHTDDMVTSRVHIHDCVIPLKDGKLNGKAFSSRRNIKRLQAEIDLMTKQDYGLQFGTGEKKKDSNTVEQLKNQSEIAQIKHEMTEKVSDIVDGYKMQMKGEFQDYLSTRKLQNGKTALQVVNGWYADFKEFKKKQASKEIEQASDDVIKDVHGTDDVQQDNPVKEYKAHKQQAVERAKSSGTVSAPASYKRKTYEDLKREVFTAPVPQHDEDDDEYGS